MQHGRCSGSYGSEHQAVWSLVFRLVSKISKFSFGTPSTYTLVQVRFHGSWLLVCRTSHQLLCPDLVGLSACLFSLSFLRQQPGGIYGRCRVL
jgi:hypothetical protein